MAYLDLRVGYRRWTPFACAAGAPDAASKIKPEPRTHDGYQWIYVLSGRMLFILADQDWVLGQGQVVAFETAVSHWFGSTGDQPAEFLSTFGRPGERMTVRTTPAQV